MILLHKTKLNYLVKHHLFQDIPTKEYYKFSYKVQGG